MNTAGHAMRQDKDRSGKWLLTHHGDSVLRLAGITGFSSWRALQTETVAPRRLPDGLIELRFRGESEPTLVLVEIETYPDADVDRQLLDDLMLIAVDRNVVPEVVSLVLKPKGKLTVAGNSERTSPRGQTRISGSWPVVRLWELEAEALLAVGDVGLVPWVSLTRTTLEPEELMTRCRDRIVQVPDANDRAGLIAVTQILAGLAFPDRRFLNLFGGPQVMIESPVLDEVKELIRQRLEAEVTNKVTAEVAAKTREAVLREAVIAVLEARFGALPAERLAALHAVTEEARLRALPPLAGTCPDLAAFFAGLSSGQ
ncbi:MAG: hypothetical protein L0241_08865 [Planctomycetia bacterium]|nr:hypothetical protein [Planctomycetia bacterium]